MLGRCKTAIFLLTLTLEYVEVVKTSELVLNLNDVGNCCVPLIASNILVDSRGSFCFFPFPFMLKLDISRLVKSLRKQIHHLEMTRVW